MPHPSVYAETYPHKAAYIMGATGEVVTFRELDEASNRAAHLFRSLGLKQGDHIGFMMDNRPEFMHLIWAAQRSGLIYTPISTHLKRDETAYILGNCGAKVFVASARYAEVAGAVVPEAQGVEHF